jgi:hypothetical protein
VDFPGLIRVDHQNSTDIAAAVERAFASYHLPPPDPFDAAVDRPPPPPADTDQSHPAQSAGEAQSNQQTGGHGHGHDSEQEHGPGSDEHGPGSGLPQSLLESPGQGEFFAYVMSLWRRVHHTADVLMASAHLHFVLRAPSLAHEHLANFQMLVRILT